MRQTKYNYYRIIQTNHGYGWDDDDWHEVDSQGMFKQQDDYMRYKENLRLYRANVQGAVRVIFRRELREPKV